MTKKQSHSSQPREIPSRRSLELLKMPFEIRHFVETNCYLRKDRSTHSISIISMALTRDQKCRRTQYRMTPLVINRGLSIYVLVTKAKVRGVTIVIVIFGSFKLLRDCPNSGGSSDHPTISTNLNHIDINHPFVDCQIDGVRLRVCTLKAVVAACISYFNFARVILLWHEQTTNA